MTGSNPPRSFLHPGTLRSRILDRTQSALECGALQSIPTAYEWVEQHQVRFLVRILTNLVRKDEATRQQRQGTSSGKAFNPFLPYEEDLFVADLSPTHLCLLNKFNVVDHHLLVITRAFEEQESLLTESDFAAMGMVLREVDGLMFYNGGQCAGASQRHKHLQLVPLPFTADAPPLPIAPLVAAADWEHGIVPGLPFLHAIARLQPSNTPAANLSLYHALLQQVGLNPQPTNPLQARPYNLLATRDWMLVVPRSQEEFHGISVNSLGFAGALLVRNQAQLDLLKQKGPMTVLQQVAIAR